MATGQIGTGRVPELDSTGLDPASGSSSAQVGVPTMLTQRKADGADLRQVPAVTNARRVRELVTTRDCSDLSLRDSSASESGPSSKSGTYLAADALVPGMFQP